MNVGAGQDASFADQNKRIEIRLADIGQGRRLTDTKGLKESDAPYTPLTNPLRWAHHACAA